VYTGPVVEAHDDIYASLLEGTSTREFMTSIRGLD
jgi:hypothetical protein